MSYDVKFLSWPASGNHLIAITWGRIDANGFKELFARLAELAQPLFDCKVLIDLEQATYSLEEAEAEVIVDDLKPELWPPHLKIAIVSAPAITQFDQLLTLSTALAKKGFTVSLFYSTKAAIYWLAGMQTS